MKGSLDDAFKLELKQLILREADRDEAPESIDDEEMLFGPRATLQLDSIDALQITAALQAEYGQRVTDPKEGRRIMKNINTLADFVRPE